MPDNSTENDGRMRHCPTLGHEVPFSYCRAPAAELPCHKTCDCWWETFDVVAFVQAHYSPQQIQKILQPRQDKLATLIGLIRKAQETQ